ncbi:MAG: sodium:proton antiporter [Planctomycetes bacterium]|nr:sodium:proton antiporter [Planctomycetota bacterium]
MKPCRLLLALLLASVFCDGATASEIAGDAHSLAAGLSGISIAPFILLLLCIAVMPLAAGHWWEHNRNKSIVVLLLSLPIVLFFLPFWQAQEGHELLEKVKEYISFMSLLGALFVISGGIYVRGSLSGSPLGNTSMLALGALLASIIGTTGASVLLIRPLLRANVTRVRKAHIVVFFIFIVSNCGGLLTPIGDPPLFLGFLKGVSFFWTLKELWLQWLGVNFALLIIFQVYDQVIFGREEKERSGSQLEQVLQHEPIRIDGLLNFAFLAGIVATIVASGSGFLNGGRQWPWGIQEGLMIGLGIAGYFTTPSVNRTSNRFSFAPIIEVAVLFIGIFVTMAPALLLLNARGKELGLELPWHFFWATGILSSFLDNAPTYMTLAATACGIHGVDLSGAAYLNDFLSKGEAPQLLLRAISCGAVLMGANTYIGNGPNFMVKAIAEENGVTMPSFFGYMVYSGCILTPIFIVMTFLFFA